MTLHSTLEYCLSQQQDMVGLLEAFTNVESPSGDRDALYHFGRVVAKAFEEAGGRIEAVLDTNHGPILRIEVGQGSQQVLLLHHMDTVHPRGTLKVFPFRIVGDEAFGPGVFDMKSGIVQTVFALRAFRALFGTSPLRLVILCTPDEEGGSPVSRSLIETEGRKSACVLIPEPSEGTQGALKTSRKGVGVFKLIAKGRPSHAGLKPLEGASAIRELAYQIGRIYEMACPQEGLWINVGVIRGGTRSNVIAAEAEAEIDIRVTAKDQTHRITEGLAGLISMDERVHLVLEGGFTRPPMERTGATERLLRWAQQQASQLGFAVDEAHVGGGSDGNFTAALGIPTLDGLGAVGAGAHAAGEERVILSSLPRRTALLVELIRAVASNLSGGGKEV
jgi:glutamate carboxypeptidase